MDQVRRPQDVAAPTPQQYYGWVSPTSGSWDDPANWINSTFEPYVHAGVPGANDFAGIEGAAVGGPPLVISGNGSALTFAEHAGTVHLTGHIAVGGIFGGDGRENYPTGVIVENGGSVSAAELFKLNYLEVSGAGSEFTANTAILGYVLDVPLRPRFGDTVLTASAGGLINIGHLDGVDGGGLTVDPTSEINIGTTSGTRGVITFGKGSLVDLGPDQNTMNGTVQCDATISFRNLSHTGDLYGTGAIEVTTQGELAQHGNVAPGALTFRAADRVTMQFGSVGTGNNIILAGTEDHVVISTAPFSAAIIGFSEADTIYMVSAPVTSESYAAGRNGTGTLSLFGDSGLIQNLTFAGDYSISSFAFGHYYLNYLVVSLATQTQTIGGVSITSTSPDTLALIQSVAGTLYPSNEYSFINGVPVPPAPYPGRSTLVVPAGSTGTVAVPAGYADIIIAAGSTATVTGGDATATVVGDAFDYVGAAALVGSGSGNSTIFDSAVAARIVVGSSGQSTVTATGANASVTLGDIGHASIDLSGANSTIVTGTGSTITVSALGYGETVSVGAGTTGLVRSSGNNQTLTFAEGGLLNVVIGGTGDTIGFDVAGRNVRSGGATLRATSADTVDGSGGSGNAFLVADPASANLIALGVSDTITAAAGASTVYGRAADHIEAGSGSILFVGGGGASTIQGGSANVTVFATTAAQFDFGAAQANVFVGGSAVSTVNAHTGGGVVFGGSHGDDYNFGSSGSQVFVGGGGADTVTGRDGTVAPEIFVSGGERLIMTGSRPVTVVSFASGGVVDTSATAGNNVVFAGYGSGGNQTLIGSAPGIDAAGTPTHDTFVVGADPAGVATSIIIDNWHSGDVFYLAGFAPADVNVMDTAISNAVGQGASGDLSFTLGDNTTIAFVGNHPTNFTANAAF